LDTITDTKTVYSLVASNTDFYLKRLKAEVTEVYNRHEGLKVHLVAHSAGGWLARIFLGEAMYNGYSYNGERMVRVRSNSKLLVAVHSFACVGR
jgi:triacylglycerol esterase/lipase EstA (alpha/beta hydrolase family)